MVSNTHGRKLAILNELKIAIEQLLLERFWEPFWDWQAGQLGRGDFYKGVVDLRDGLERDNRAPSMLDYKRLWEAPAANEYWSGKDLSDSEIAALKSSLGRLYRALRLRGAAEHEPRADISSEELESSYRLALGIGEKGLLPSVARTLLDHQ